SFLGRLLFGDSTEEVLSAKRVKEDKQQHENLKSFLQGKGVDEEAVDLLAKHENGDHLTSGEKKEWQRLDLDHFYDHHSDVRQALDNDFWQKPPVREPEEPGQRWRSGRGPEEPPEETGGRKVRPRAPDQPPQGGRGQGGASKRTPKKKGRGTDTRGDSHGVSMKPEPWESNPWDEERVHLEHFSKLMKSLTADSASDGLSSSNNGTARSLVAGKSSKSR
ncbi:MAG TPA: hypothetical protein VFV38_33105, partial [Ktedonobacteraceae bacterium]|nr:hypothetical protein [Ktedonobacteraceae bacterium]